MDFENMNKIYVRDVGEDENENAKLNRKKKDLKGILSQSFLRSGV